MAQIPTASELIRLQFCEGEFDEIMDCLNGSIETDITQAMIDFAKLHVEAALKEASEKALVYADEGGYSEFVDEQSILNSYSLDNIK
jgi:hypothetical protein